MYCCIVFPPPCLHNDGNAPRLLIEFPCSPSHLRSLRVSSLSLGSTHGPSVSSQSAAVCSHRGGPCNTLPHAAIAALPNICRRLPACLPPSLMRRAMNANPLSVLYPFHLSLPLSYPLRAVCCAVLCCVRDRAIVRVSMGANNRTNEMKCNSMSNRANCHKRATQALSTAHRFPLASTQQTRRWRCQRELR